MKLTIAIMSAAILTGCMNTGQPAVQGLSVVAAVDPPAEMLPCAQTLWMGRMAPAPPALQCAMRIHPHRTFAAAAATTATRPKRT